MERIQKILARGGLASRRNAEQLITEGRVRVNGRVVNELGAKADPRNDKIEVDGKRVIAEHAVYVVLHKPRGVVATMSDPEGRPTVAEILANVGARVFPVGRLDFATSGVLLATNDGELSDGLLHPKKAVPKTYIVKVHGKMTKEDLDRWREGVQLEDGKTLPAEAKVVRFEGDKTWFELTIKEGRNQQIRRMGEATRFPVMRLARLSFASVTAEGLRPGQWRHMTRDELVQLKKTYGVPRSIVTPPVQEHAPARRTRAPEPKRGNAARTYRARGEERPPESLPTRSNERFTARDRVARARAARPQGDAESPESLTATAAREDARPVRARPAGAERPAREGAAPFRGRSDGGERPARESAAPVRSRSAGGDAAGDRGPRDRAPSASGARGRSAGGPPPRGRSDGGGPPPRGRSGAGAPPSRGRSDDAGAPPSRGRSGAGVPPARVRSDSAAPPARVRSDSGASPARGRSEAGAPPGGGARGPRESFGGRSGGAARPDRGGSSGRGGRAGRSDRGR